MPLLKRKPHVPLEPPAELKPLDRVYQIRFTKEIFCDYHQYLNRMNLYRQRLWTCKMTGKSNLTFEEALVSEQRASEKVKQLPSELVETALRSIQFCMLPLRDLVHEVTEKLQEHLFEGIELFGKKDNGVHLCRLLRILEEGPGVTRYEVVWLDTDKKITESTVMNGEDLIRKKLPFTREVLKSFIRESTYRSIPWVLHDGIAKKYGIQTAIPEELRSQVFLDDDLRVCNKTKKTAKGGKEKSACQRKIFAESNEADQSIQEPVKYPIDDLLVQLSFDDPVFTERPLPSSDFIVPTECIGDLLMVWDFCSSYGRLLHIWPFSLDDFENALCRKDTNLVILVEAHSALLRFLIKDGGAYASAIQAKKRKLKITLLKWAEYLCDFLEIIDLPELRNCISTIKRGHYGLLESHFKVKIFRELVDHAIATESFREKIEEYVEQRQELGASRREEALEDAKRRRKDKEDVKLDSVTNGAADVHSLDFGESNLQLITTGNNRERNGNAEGIDVVVYRRRRPCDKSNDSRTSAVKYGNGQDVELDLQDHDDDNGKKEVYKTNKDHRREYYEKEMEKRVIRANPLGIDRHFNRYWWFFRDSRIFVESSDSKQWGFYSTKEELDAFMGSLNLKGIRERALFKKLENHYQRISSKLQKRSKDIARSMTSDEAVVRRSTRVRAPPGDNPANSFLNYENKWKEINL
uniref:DDT domain-containing protein n=1 Tax=Kalanchoe fedtschenkoi TaxID=63787 RepID=A0A7N0TNB0_KALFE